jgi:hypothetical protein
MDALLTVSSNQAVTASAVSTNTIDLSGNRDIGGGEPLYMLFTVTAAMLAAGAATVTFNVVADDDPALGSPVVVSSTGAIPKADLGIGAQFAVAIQPQAGLGLRYVGASYTVANGPLTTGTVTAGIVRNYATTAKYYPSGYTVG